MAVLDRSHSVLEITDFNRFVGIGFVACTAIDDEMRRQLEAAPGATPPSAPVLDVMTKRPLTVIQINGGEPLTAFISATATCIAIVLFPEPPFSFPTTITCGTPADFGAAFNMDAPRQC
jgi:hypothetical protein